MKRILLIIVGILVLVFIVGTVLFLFNQSSTTTTTTTTNSNPINGTSAGTGISNSVSSNSGGTNSTSEGYAVKNVMGGIITTNDFIHNGVTVQDTENPTQYYLAGSVGYCLKNGTCPSGASSTDFSVIYRTSNQAFVISLLREPLGQSRAEAEQFMEKTLGLSQTQMCDLNYYVLTSDSVNSLYAGTNLGFDFCPGATDLPQ